MSTLQEIELFSKFAREQLDRGGTELTMSELFTLWENRHRSSDLAAEDIAAIRESLDDMRRGAPTRDVDEVLKELRIELGLTADQ